MFFSMAYQAGLQKKKKERKKKKKEVAILSVKGNLTHLNYEYRGIYFQTLLAQSATVRFEVRLDSS